MNKNILLALEGNELVVVLGNDLSIVKLEKAAIPNYKVLLSEMESAQEDNDHIRVNIKEYLPFVLWQEYESVNAPPSPFDLNNVVETLVHNRKTNEDDIKAYIIRIVKGLTDQQIVLDPFKKLAKIGNIETILSVNFDNFLERAFEAEGLKLNPSVNFSIQDNNQTEHEIDKDKALVSIFNLMGNIQDSDFAITEEMQLEYLYSLQMRKDNNTKALFDAVKNKSILFVGCSFPNWFMRFFIRTISKNRYKTGRSKFVASDRTSQDQDLSKFLEYNKTSVIPIGALAMGNENAEQEYKNTIEFIDELFVETQKSETIVTDNKPRYKEKVFLSYSWDDKPIIKKLKNEFDKCGVDMFYDDDDLRNGEQFADTINEYIVNCDYVLPIISDNSLSRKDSYVYDKEWKLAINVETMRKYNGSYNDGEATYLRPYIIDGTSPVDDRIPQEIRDKNITTLASDDDFAPMVRKFIKENNLTEIED